jgi:hypothetical protein
MKKIVFILPVLLIVLSMTLYAQESIPNKNQKYAATGIIKSAEYQGNNYLKLTVTTINANKEILIWCSAGKTKIFAATNAVTWTELKPGQKIGIVGKWIEEEGEKLLHASRIDLL